VQRGTPLGDEEEQDDQAGAPSEQRGTKRKFNDGGAASAGILRDVVAQDAVAAKELQTERLEHEAKRLEHDAAEKAADRAHALQLAQMAAAQQKAALDAQTAQQKAALDAQTKQHEETMRMVLQLAAGKKFD
jgi:hypothetical protein